jgi:hypothetical protein
VFFHRTGALKGGRFFIPFTFFTQRMKKHTLLFAYFCLLLLAIGGLYSCSKDAETKPEPAVNQQLINELMASSQSIIRLGLPKLSPEEKVVLWTKHLDNQLNKPGLSPEFRTHILKLKPILTVQLFRDADLPSTQAFMAKFTEEWYTIPLKKGLFTDDDLLHASTVYGLGVKALPKTLDDNTELTSTSSCSCYYSMSCDGSMYCQDGKCEQGGTCGIFGTSNCTGKCK